MENVDERETLKANWAGWSAKRRVRRVLFPEPDGPERTKGRDQWGPRADMGPIDRENETKPRARVGF
jgi:hypothetical protein